MSQCRNDAICAGGMYPKSCPRCGLGGDCTNHANKAAHLAYKDQKMIIQHAKTLQEIKTEEQELKNKLIEIQCAKERLLKQERIARNQKILENKESLLKVIEHGRTSCSDDNISNGFHSADYGPRCSRCALLELDDYNLDEYDINLRLEFNKP